MQHRYFDGELPASEAATVRGHLTSCEHCTARHGALSSLRQMITVAAEQSSLDVDFDRAFLRIEREVRGQSREQARGQSSEQGLLEQAFGWLKTTLQDRPERLWAPALGVAAAAALLLVLGREDRGPEMAKSAQSTVEPAVEATAVAGTSPVGTAGSEPTAGLPEGALAMASSEVVQVDFGDQTGTVFEVAVADGVSTPVVWINQ
jgi:anti-sigma factor RsiW